MQFVQRIGASESPQQHVLYMHEPRELESDVMRIWERMRYSHLHVLHTGCRVVYSS